MRRPFLFFVARSFLTSLSLVMACGRETGPSEVWLRVRRCQAMRLGPQFLFREGDLSQLENLSNALL